MSNHKCGGVNHIFNEKKKLIRKPDVRPDSGGPIRTLSGLSYGEKKKAIYSEHTEQVGYKKVKVHSAYLGLVDLDVYDLGNGYVALQTLVKGIGGKSDIFVKEINARKYNLYPNKYQYQINYLAQLQPTFINLKHAEHHSKIIEKLEAQRKIAKLNGGELKPHEKKQLHNSYIYNNAVDIHFNTCQYLDFLHKHTAVNNVANSNILLSMHNVKELDNAFWTGEYMVYGNGDKMFYPLGTSDVGGHEAGHGLVQTTAGLKYQGHSGALNESFADILGVCFEFYLYYKFNNIKGKSDWLIGEDSGKQVEYLRNMKDPTLAKYPQPKVYKGEYWMDPNDKDKDYGGVHTNSGVGNYCFYCLSVEIGWEKALKIFWSCLKKLGPNSSYMDFRDCLKSSSGSPEVKSALNKAGLYDHSITDWKS